MVKPYFLALLIGPLAIRGADDLAARVIVLANQDDPDSLRIAQHYANVRSVPAGNIIALHMPTSESISWREFISTIWQPLLDRLVASRWVDAIPMSLTDAVGRRKYAPHGHRIAALVLCRGVPLKINHDPALLEEVPPLTKRAEFRTNAGAVDAELALLAQPNYPINAFVPNPLFQNDHPTASELSQVVKVSRLDGPTFDDANTLVDRAVTAERTGLAGRAYVDLANRDPVGDRWLESAATQLTALGFDTDVDRNGTTFPITARIDAPVLYFGWYASDIDGPFLLPGFRFAPGAIALHIHSFSAASLRQRQRHWVGGLVARGVTATFGNVYEPYLSLTHRPDLLLRALARAATLVDAALYSLYELSWQAIVIGDPLYRPFAVSLEDQLGRRAEVPAALAGYVVLRRMHQLDAVGKKDEALALAKSAQAKTPSLAVGLELSTRLRAAGDNEGAGRALEFATRGAGFEPNDGALAVDVARMLAACDRVGAARDVWRILLGAAVPVELRRAWLPDAIKAARAAGDSGQAESWKNEYERLGSVR